MRLEHSTGFPSQAVSDLEKLSEKYGLKLRKLYGKNGFQERRLSIIIIKIIFIH